MTLFAAFPCNGTVAMQLSAPWKIYEISDAIVGISRRTLEHCVTYCTVVADAVAKVNMQDMSRPALLRLVSAILDCNHSLPTEREGE